MLNVYGTGHAALPAKGVDCDTDLVGCTCRSQEADVTGCLVEALVVGAAHAAAKIKIVAQSN